MMSLLLAADAAKKITFIDIINCPTAWALVLSVIGLWLLLPQAIKRGKTIGALLLVRQGDLVVNPEAPAPDEPGAPG